MTRQKEPHEQHLSGELAALSPEEALGVRMAGGRFQRGPAERSMDALQAHGGGVLSHAAEHIGDLTNRMNKNGPTDIIMSDTMPKVMRQRDHMHSRYGFEREHEENMASNSRMRGTDLTEHRANVRASGQAYADAHRGVPVYNYPSEVARDAAISLGEGRYDDTRRHMDHLQTMEFGGKHDQHNSYAEGDMAGLLHMPRPGAPAAHLEGHKQSMLDYQHGWEASQKHITDASQVMLGGRLKP